MIHGRTTEAQIVFCLQSGARRPPHRPSLRSRRRHRRSRVSFGRKGRVEAREPLQRHKGENETGGRRWWWCGGLGGGLFHTHARYMCGGASSSSLFPPSPLSLFPSAHLAAALPPPLRLREGRPLLPPSFPHPPPPSHPASRRTKAAACVQVSCCWRSKGWATERPPPSNKHEERGESGK